ncbi:DsbA family protein [Enterovirga rhinocerotis]|uniref:Protein-disulfide isomerase n=1 Tax=Enterovirga rhinocerotis TaxID=1339210 RepID=A0A4R7BHU5_9HYPH|nr:DsbA family protein [Enterovirga rhinocerotis]TDR84493.1 protein-disulfide isomerase [Enterovirga rhinocerotis]
MNRRDILLGAAALGAWPLYNYLKPVPAWSSPDVKGILHDPDAPESGNAKGDVTIVSFFDYNCPFCKTSASHLDKAMRQDGRVRLIYKDWPILTPASVYGAQIALGSKYQGRYTTAYQALMGIPGRRIANEAMRDAVAAAGVDMTRLQADLDKNSPAISALLQRTMNQADSMGLRGTPVYLIGPYAYASALDEGGFRKAIATARAGKPS